MEYKVEVLLSAQMEIEEAFDYYSGLNDNLPIKFQEELKVSYRRLAINPFYQKRYKNFRILPLNKFPYILIYSIVEISKKVKIISCFHTSQSPEKYP